MRDDEDEPSRFPKLVDGLSNRAHVAPVQAARRLVEHDDGFAGGHGGADGQALLLAPRERVGVMLREVGEVEHVEDAGDPFVDVARPLVAEAQLLHGALFVQLVIRFLHDEVRVVAEPLLPHL